MLLHLGHVCATCLWPPSNHIPAALAPKCGCLYLYGVVRHSEGMARANVKWRFKIIDVERLFQTAAPPQMKGSAAGMPSPPEGKLGKRHIAWTRRASWDEQCLEHRKVLHGVDAGNATNSTSPERQPGN